MLQSKRGAALLQVILVAAVLAGIATLLLRAGLSRTTNARLTRREVTAQMLIQSCQAQVNVLWSMKKPEIFARDLTSGDGCWMTCNLAADSDTACTDTGGSANAKHDYTCTPVAQDGVTYQVTAIMGRVPSDDNSDRRCQITYELTDREGGSRVTL